MPSGDACPACGGPLSAWRPVSASEPGLNGQLFALRRCPDCATAVTDGSQPTVDVHDSGELLAGLAGRGATIAVLARRR